MVWDSISARRIFWPPGPGRNCRYSMFKNTSIRFTMNRTRFCRDSVNWTKLRCGSYCSAKEFPLPPWNSSVTRLESKKVFRIKGGNQLMTDAFSERLGERVHLGCPVTAIEHGPSGAGVTY